VRFVDAAALAALPAILEDYIRQERDLSVPLDPEAVANDVYEIAFALEHEHDRYIAHENASEESKSNQQSQEAI
jgi:hypothetical protein